MSEYGSPDDEKIGLRLLLAVVVLALALGAMAWGASVLRHDCAEKDGHLVRNICVSDDGRILP